jgi:hypothetical protein
VDKRYHLFGAAEGWLEAGHVVNQQKDLEIRTFDHDRDGFFDTWQVFEGQGTVPVRVSRVTAPRATMVKLSREMLAEEYNGRILPEAIRENETLIAALKKRAESSSAAAYEDEARGSAFAERKRYCLDLARELYFLKVRDALYAGNAAGPYPRLEQAAGRRTLERATAVDRYTVGDSLAFWKQALAIEGFVVAYGEGRINDAREILERIAAGR